MLGFDEVGFLRARVLMRCEELGLNDVDVRSLLFPGLGSSAHEWEIRVRILDELFRLLLNMPSSERKAWLRTSSSDLGGKSPLQLATGYSSGLRTVRNMLRRRFDDR